MNFNPIPSRVNKLGNQLDRIKAVAEQMYNPIDKNHLFDHKFGVYQPLLLVEATKGHGSEKVYLRIFWSGKASLYIVTIPGTSDAQDLRADMNRSNKITTVGFRALAGVYDVLERYEITFLRNGVSNIFVYPALNRNQKFFLTFGNNRVEIKGLMTHTYQNLPSLIASVMGLAMSGLLLTNGISTDAPDGILLMGHSLGGGIVQILNSFMRNKTWMDTIGRSMVDQMYNPWNNCSGPFFFPQVKAITFGCYASIVNDQKYMNKHLPIYTTDGHGNDDAVLRTNIVGYNIGPRKLILSVSSLRTQVNRNNNIGLKAFKSVFKGVDDVSRGISELTNDIVTLAPSFNTTLQIAAFFAPSDLVTDLIVDTALSVVMHSYHSYMTLLFGGSTINKPLTNFLNDGNYLWTEYNNCP